MTTAVATLKRRLIRCTYLLPHKPLHPTMLWLADAFTELDHRQSVPLVSDRNRGKWNTQLPEISIHRQCATLAEPRCHLFLSAVGVTDDH